MPGQAIAYIQARLDDLLASKRNLEGVTSLAAGADQLFAQTVLALGGQLRVVVPCAGYEATFSDSADKRNFRALLDQATAVDRLDFDAPSEEAFLAAGQSVADSCELLLAIWDGQQSRGLGGTADIVAYAKDRDTAVEVVWPEGIER